jgi:hypothetical protein
VEGAWGMATANIDISADRCLAYTWHHMSYEGNTQFEKRNGRLMKMQVDVADSHSRFMISSLMIPFPGVDHRVYPARWAWRREENGAFVAGFTFKGAPRASEASAKEERVAQFLILRARPAPHARKARAYCARKASTPHPPNSRLPRQP